MIHGPYIVKAVSLFRLPMICIVDVSLLHLPRLYMVRSQPHALADLCTGIDWEFGCDPSTVLRKLLISLLEITYLQNLCAGVLEN